MCCAREREWDLVGFFARRKLSVKHAQIAMIQDIAMRIVTNVGVKDEKPSAPRGWEDRCKSDIWISNRRENLWGAPGSTSPLGRRGPLLHFGDEVGGVIAGYWVLVWVGWWWWLMVV